MLGEALVVANRRRQWSAPEVEDGDVGGIPMLPSLHASMEGKRALMHSSGGTSARRGEESGRELHGTASMAALLRGGEGRGRATDEGKGDTV